MLLEALSLPPPGLAAGWGAAPRDGEELASALEPSGCLCHRPPSGLVRLAIFHAELRKLESIGAQSSSLWAIFKL